MNWDSLTRTEPMQPDRVADPAHESAADPDQAASELQIAMADRRRRRRRRLIVWAARIVTFVVFFGGWQLLADAKIVDPFFWGKPSGIVTQLKDWVNNGTQYGSLWLQIWTTMKEALLGFVYGVIAGVVVGVLLGESEFLTDVLSPYIK
ncbi:MAG: hypothetical protein JO027_10215, partial [Solirubrobacterales bacterium]|nr:hypothetical protein [Solirubrobacterales bacterium]